MNTLKLARITALALSKQLHSNPFDQDHATKLADRLVELTKTLEQQGEPACGLCGESEAFTGTCGGGRNDPKTLCYTPAAQSCHHDWGFDSEHSDGSVASFTCLLCGATCENNAPAAQPKGGSI